MKIKLELEYYEIDHLHSLTQMSLDEHNAFNYNNQKEANEVYDFMKEVHDKIGNCKLDYEYKINKNKNK
jgi:hypothetical protein